jgi:hypothetical protein
LPVAVLKIVPDRFGAKDLSQKMTESERTARGRSYCMADARLDSRASRRRSLLLLGAATVALLADGTGAAADGLTIADTPGAALLVAQSQTISSLAGGGSAGGTVTIADARL